jgi:hypothetical protein
MQVEEAKRQRKIEAELERQRMLQNAQYVRESDRSRLLVSAVVPFPSP